MTNDSVENRPMANQACEVGGAPGLKPGDRVTVEWGGERLKARYLAEPTDSIPDFAWVDLVGRGLMAVRNDLIAPDPAGPDTPSGDSESLITKGRRERIHELEAEVDRLRDENRKLANAVFNGAANFGDVKQENDRLNVALIRERSGPIILASQSWLDAGPAAAKTECRLALADVLAALPPGASVTFIKPEGDPS